MLSDRFGSNPAQPGFILILPLTSTAVEEQVVQERIGLYGVMIYTVERRTKKIGIPWRLVKPTHKSSPVSTVKRSPSRQLHRRSPRCV